MDRLLAPGIWQIDTLLGGWEEVNAVFLVEGPRPCLVETGPQLNGDTVIEALRGRGLGPDDLGSVILTHIHLDHGGAVGEVAAQFPRATIYCHPKGARHLADPTRLVAAAGLVYGERLDSLYGGMRAVPQDRLVAAEHRSRVDLGGGRFLLVVHSPGHAKHHVAVQDSQTGLLLVGDAVGVQIPGGGPLRPATPPDDFDLELAINSLHLFAELQPSQLVLTHFGPAGEPQEVLADAEERLRSWSSVARAAYLEDPSLDHIEAALRRRQPSQPEIDPSRAAAADTLNGLRSNAAGLQVWLRRQQGPGTA